MEFIRNYFTAEKSESLIFMVMGVITITFSVYVLIKWGDSFYKGFAIPVILIGLIQLAVGSTVYFRTDKQVQDLESLFQKNKKAFIEGEIPRMEVVMKNFSLYKKVEVAFVVIGLVLIFMTSSKEFWLGVGAGMLLQGALMLTADIFAERRGTSYQQSLRSINKDQQ
jgi:hypothetical protein